MQVSQHTHIPARLNKHLMCPSAEERERERERREEGLCVKDRKKKGLREKEGGCCGLWLSHVEVD